VILIVGSNGNLSSALQQMYQDTEIRIIGSEIAQRWTDEDSLNKVENDLEDLKIFPDLIINAAGEINPKARPSKLLAVNYFLPRNLQDYSQRKGIKLVTFGSILENLEDVANSNPYLTSKRKYFDYFEKEISHNTNSLHLQIHTWYGLKMPSNSMFLGQMYQALKDKKVFHMSDGTQLREYHNVFDDLKAVQQLLKQETDGVVQINHGEVFSLREIAKSIFDSFNSTNLLCIGTVSAPEHEVFVKHFQPNALLESIQFRPTIEGLITDFKRLLGDQL
jgi:nucleoside-diphosphate-sugar epimerase